MTICPTLEIKISQQKNKKQYYLFWLQLPTFPEQLKPVMTCHNILFLMGTWTIHASINPANGTETTRTI